MQSLFFWKSWPKSYRWLWYTMATLLIGSMVMLWTFHFMGYSASLNWEKIQEQKVIETTVHSFRLGQFQLSVPAESYVIEEYMAGGEVFHNFTATYLYLAVIIFSVIILLTIITTLEKFWFFGGMSLFILFMITLRLDVLKLFGLENQTVAFSVLVIYLIAAFYFRYIRSYTTFISRFLTFLIITLAAAMLVALFSTVQNPALHLLVTSYTPAIILSVLFIIMVAHEILVSFVYITNQTPSGNSAKHFLIVSFIYLAYVLITCLHEIGVVKWNFIYIDLYFLLTCSGMLGIWGFRLREPLYHNIFSFSPFGAFFVLALACICFATTAQLLGNNNDAALKVIRDVIAFSHTGFGLVFIMYFLSNFLGMMGENLPVYNVLYRPNRMPYFTFRFAGLIVALAFLFTGNWRDFVSHGVGGFYNYVGDMHDAEGNATYALTFYEQARSRAFQSHRANYILASKKIARLNFSDAARNYELANGRRPSEFSLTNGANLNFWEGRYFDAIRDFLQADEILPKVPAIQNNLGFAYSKVHNIDSASYYFNEARKSELTRNSAEANFFAMAANELIPIKSDSVLRYFNTESPSVEANALALATLFDQQIKTNRDPLSAKPLDLYSATLLNNYINRFTKTLDTTFIARAYQIASDSLNLNYAEALKASLAHAYYHHGQVFKALEIMGELAYITQDHQGKFNYIMGLWALDQNAPEVAVKYFTFAETADYKNAKFYNAIAQTEGGKITDAIVSWDSLILRQEPAVQAIAEQIKPVLTLSPAQAMNLPDARKYQYTRYRISLHDTVLFNQIVNSFGNVNYKAQAYLDRATELFKSDNIEPAIRYLNRVAGLQLTDKRLYDEIRQLELLMLASRKEIRALARQINKDITFDGKYQLHKILYTALIQEQSGDTLNAALNFQFIAKANPFFDEGIIAASEFFRNSDPESLKAYDILVNAIHVNTHSVKLLKAYAAEAFRQGYENYATSALGTLGEIESQRR